MSETASDGAKDGIPRGARYVARTAAFLELGFVERAREVQSRVAQEDSATGDGVDGFALAKGKTGGFTYGADFLAVRIFAAGAMR